MTTTGFEIVVEVNVDPVTVKANVTTTGFSIAERAKPGDAVADRYREGEGVGELDGVIEGVGVIDAAD